MVAKPKAARKPYDRPSAELFVARRFSRHPERYHEIFWVLKKHRLHRVVAELRRAAGEDDEAQPAALVAATSSEHPEALAAALEELGPCFIKLGQLLSTRPDVLPPPYIRALARLQSTVAPVPSAEVVRIVEGELGAPLGALFAAFDPTPLAAASMAQVHRATLPDGRAAVVKVQRPRVRHRIEVDLVVLGEVARAATRYTPIGKRYNLPQLVRELEQSLGQELDFRQEADHTRLIGRLLADFPRLATPEVIPERSGGRVLTLTYIQGRPLAALGPEEKAALDAPAIARELLTAYLKQIVVDGIFHCDPHPGNILLADDGRLTLLDFGMVGRLDAGQKDHIIQLLLAFSERQGERVADMYLALEPAPRRFDRWAFTQAVSGLVSRYHDLSGGRMDLGTALLDLGKLAHAHQAPVPAVLTLLGKTLLNLDGTIRALSPALDPVGLVRDYMVEVMGRRILTQLAPGRSFAWLLDMKHLFENGPRRTDTILGKLANDQFTVRLGVDHEAVRTLDRAAARLSRSLIASALLVGGGYVVGGLVRRNGQGH